MIVDVLARPKSGVSRKQQRGPVPMARLDTRLENPWTVEQDVAGTAGITVVVADRHPLVRRALRDLIDREPGFSVPAHVPDLEAVRLELGRHLPHVLLFEPQVLGGAGLVRLPSVLAPSPRTRAVVLTDEPSTALERHVADHGAAGLVVKHAPPDELFAALRRAVGGLWPQTAEA
jgi:DNA-binding NarL/FixJ family response regulator